MSVIKGGIEIAQVAEPGVIFGELSALLDQLHTADVRTVEASQFHVADARARPGRAAVYRLQAYVRGLSPIPVTIGSSARCRSYPRRNSSV